MKLLYKNPVIVLIFLLVIFIIYYITTRYKEGIALLSNTPGNNKNAPARSPNSDPPIISDSFCAAINQIKTDDPLGTENALNELIQTNDPNFNEAEKQIIMGIKGNQAIYQGQFLEIQKKLCQVYSKIKLINKKLPKTSDDIVIGTVGQCSFNKALEGETSISIDISNNLKDSNYATWKINAVLPSGPPGEMGPTGTDGDAGKTGDPGPQGERGIRGEWSQKPNPIPEDTQNKGYYKTTNSASTYSIY
jgi:hypothetical protein